MGAYKPPANEQEFEQNFQQIKPLMNKTESYYEASRCLFCYDPPCQKACPTGIDIPLFIRQITTGDMTGSARTIYAANYFGNACGKVCPTEVLCEGACVYTEQNVKPIEIGRLQNYATDQAIENGKKLFNLASPNGRKVAVIGAGPAGISAACELRTLGYAVDIYEAKSRPSGLTVHGVAPYKITNEDVLKEMDYLQKQFGYTVKYNSPVRNREKLQDLETLYDALFFGIGLGKTNALGIAGEELKNSVGATEWIEALRLNHHRMHVPKRVVVLGGGNTAMDAASESARMGAERVILAYRRDADAMGAYDFEYDLVKAAGVESLFNARPVAILGHDKVEGVAFVRTENKNGQLADVRDSDFTVPCDLVIRATGQSKYVKMLQQIPGLTLDAKDRIEVNDQTFQTGHPKYFAAGDAVNGGKEVVNAAAEGKQAALGIHQYLSS